MKAIYVLMVNYDYSSMNTYAALLAGQGITPRTASTMTEALNMLLTDDYSGIVINADDFEYLPYLKIMRALTPVPIGIAVSRYDRREHDVARESGANLYRPRHDSREYRIQGFSDVVKIYLEFSKWQNKEQTAIIHNGIHILPDTCEILVGDKKAGLSGTEFNILRYLVRNKGRILTYEQIYDNVWGKEYADASHGTLWWHMSMLRRKLQKAGLSDFIKTKYGIGYSVGR